LKIGRRLAQELVGCNRAFVFIHARVREKVRAALLFIPDMQQRAAGALHAEVRPRGRALGKF
jgi:hypothetical protein